MGRSSTFGGAVASLADSCSAELNGGDQGERNAEYQIRRVSRNRVQGENEKHDADNE